MNTNKMTELRIASQLDGRYYCAKIGKKSYIFVGGIVLPKNIGIAIILNVMVRKSYWWVKLTQSDIDELIALNPTITLNFHSEADLNLSTPYEFECKISEIMKSWEPQDFDRLYQM